MGELHLEILTDRMVREFGVNARVSKLQVAYRETISTAAEARGTHIHKTDEDGIYGDVHLTVEPLERSEGFQFQDTTDETQIPRQYIPFIAQALEGAMATGPRIGYPLQDIKVTLTGAPIIQLIPQRSLLRQLQPSLLRTQSERRNRCSWSRLCGYTLLSPTNISVKSSAT